MEFRFEISLVAASDTAFPRKKTGDFLVRSQDRDSAAGKGKVGTFCARNVFGNSEILGAIYPPWVGAVVGGTSRFGIQSFDFFFLHFVD